MITFLWNYEEGNDYCHVLKPDTGQSSLHTHSQCSSCCDRSPDMAAGFGFSVGDFITAIKLLWSIVDAVKECGESTAEYRGLVEDLWHLETAFTQVTRLEFDESLASEREALKKAAEHVETIIRRFNDKTKKFKEPLSIGGSDSKVRNSWKKVQWALFKKEDVAKFREQLRCCTGTLNLLITTAQMYLLH
jgi:hypothetical protein